MHRIQCLFFSIDTHKPLANSSVPYRQEAFLFDQ